jgi:hypothetical protein
MFKRYVNESIELVFPSPNALYPAIDAANLIFLLFTAASPGPSAGLPLPDRPLWLVAPFLLSLLDLQAQMPTSLERFTRSSVPSSTVCNTFFYAFYPEVLALALASWGLLNSRKIFSGQQQHTNSIATIIELYESNDF